MSAVSFASAGYICPNPLDRVTVVIEVTELVGTITESDTPLVGSVAGTETLTGVIGATAQLTGAVGATDSLSGTITETGSLTGSIECIHD